MKNRGYVTVILAVLLSGLLILFIAVFTMINVRSGQGRSAAAFRSAMSSVRAEYERYLFEQYHVLLLDTDPDGEGMGKLEALVEERLSDNLGGEVTAGEVAITGKTGLMEDNLSALKNQVEAAVPYLAAEYGVEKLKEKVGSGAGVTEESFADGNAASQNGKIDNEFSGTPVEQKEPEEEKKYTKSMDPRKKTRKYGASGVPALIAPEDMVLSDTVLVPGDLPSSGKTGDTYLGVDSDFRSYRKMKREMIGTDWVSGIGSAGAGLVYAASCFNCLTNEVQEDTALRLEMEYLVSGEKTDGENYTETVRKMIALRTGCNLAYLLTDAEKMEICHGVAAAVCAIFPPAIPIVKYLIAAAWSYLEAIADGYRLVHGKKVPFLKTRNTWITGVEGLVNWEESMEGDDPGNGLDYREYLMVLMTMNMDSAYYRMLDLMQCNANLNREEGAHQLNLLNAVTGLTMSAEFSVGERSFTLTEEIGY